MKSAVLVNHGELRDRCYIDLSFEGSEPVRVFMPIEQYEQVILPQVAPHLPQFIGL